MKLRFTVFALAWGASMPHAIAQPEIRTESPACPPNAMLRGQDPLVSELESELRDLDIKLKSSPDCPSTEVRVEALSSGFFISLQEESGRSAYRQVGTLLIAAIWIDSWLQEDLSASLLAVRSFPGQYPASQDQQPAGTVVVGSSSSAPTPDNSLSSWTVGLAYDSSTASDNTDWQGIRGNLCYPLSTVCVGPSIRVAEAQTTLSEERISGTFSQNSQDLLLTLRTEIPLGRSRLVPEVGLGYGRLATSRTSPECIGAPPGACPDLDETLPSSRSSWAPQAELALALTLPLSHGIRVSLGGAVNVRPFGASAALSKSPPSPLPCEPVADPVCLDEPPVPALDELYLPSDPDRFWRLSIGVELSL